MSVLHVEVEDFVSAAEHTSARVGDPIDAALGTLSAALRGSEEMAGDDPGGAAWSDVYDPAARSVVTATTQLVNAVYRTAAMFGRSASNYAEAEDASTPGGLAGSTAGLLRRVPPDTGLTQLRVPSAAGGDADPPAAWWLIQHTVGYVWPNGHQDRLRRAAAGWSACADALSDVATVVTWPAAAFDLDNLPEAHDIGTVCAGLRNRMEQLAEAHRTLATACTELAGHIDHCHDEVYSELTELGVESAGIQVIGGIISVATLGTAEAPTQGVQAARIAAVAARVGDLIRDFVAAARTACEAIPTITELAERIARTLEPLLGNQLVVAGVGRVPAAAGRVLRSGSEAARGLRMSRSAENELAATERLAGSTGNNVWTTWQNYPKVMRDGREYAQIGDRLYTKHAVQRMQPGGFGAPAGVTEPGRSISPNIVDEVMANGDAKAVLGPLGQARTAFTGGQVRVIVEDDIVITVIRVRKR